MGDLAFLNIDPTEQPKSRSFDPLPPGVYDAMVEDCTLKRTKDLTGQYLEVRVQIIGHPFDGRLVFDRITIQSDNEKAVSYGRDKLLSLIRATGVPGKDSQEFIGKTMRVKLKIKPATEQYDASNEVVTYTATDKAGVRPAATTSTVKGPIVAKDTKDEIPF